jgi:amino acid transporter
MTGQDDRQQQLGLGSVISIIVGIIIGAGIYETPPDIFSQLPSAVAAYAVWGGCGLLALIGALCYAELATTYPRSGGDYVYLTRAYGPMVGYLFGWAQLAVVQTGSIGLMAYIFAGYATRLFPVYRLVATPPDAADEEAFRAYYDYSPVIYAAVAVVAMSLLNIAGVTLGKWAQNFLTFVKVVCLLGIVVVGFAFSRPERVAHEGTVVRTEAGSIVVQTGGGAEETFVVNPKATKLRIAHGTTHPTEKDAKGKARPVALADFEPGTEVKVVTRKNETTAATRIDADFRGISFGPLMGVMVLVLLTYGGWNDAAFVAAEVRNPGRNIPWALILGTFGVTVIYLLVNAAYVNGLGFEGAQDTDAVAADMLGLLPGELGQHGETAMCILVMISAIGAINGLIFTSSRIYATLGQDYSLFRPLAPAEGGSTPVASLILQLIISLLMIVSVGTPFGRYYLGIGLNYLGQDVLWVAPGGFLPILKMTAPIFWLFFLLTGLAVFWLRINDPAERPFRAPLFPLTPLIFCAMCAYMLYSGINFAGGLGWVGAVLVLAGLPFYVLSRRATTTEQA